MFGSPHSALLFLPPSARLGRMQRPSEHWAARGQGTLRGHGMARASAQQLLVLASMRAAAKLLSAAGQHHPGKKCSTAAIGLASMAAAAKVIVSSRPAAFGEEVQNSSCLCWLLHELQQILFSAADQQHLGKKCSTAAASPGFHVSCSKYSFQQQASSIGGRSAGAALEHGGCRRCTQGTSAPEMLFMVALNPPRNVARASPG